MDCMQSPMTLILCWPVFMKFWKCLHFLPIDQGMDFLGGCMVVFASNKHV